MLNFNDLYMTDNNYYRIKCNDDIRQTFNNLVDILPPHIKMRIDYKTSFYTSVRITWRINAPMYLNRRTGEFRAYPMLYIPSNPIQPVVFMLLAGYTIDINEPNCVPVFAK